MMTPYHIFISYSHQNRSLVDHLSSLLKSVCPKVTIFDAEYSIDFGDDIALAVYNELIPRTDSVVLLWSPEAANSKWVQTEAAYSFLFGKHIILIKTDPNIPVVSTLQHLKYVSAYRFSSLTACFSCVSQQIAKRVRRQSLCKRLLLEAIKSRYAFSRDDDAFYNFAVDHLKNTSSGTSLYISGSPVAVLPRESDTDARRQYLEQLLYRYTKHGGSAKGKYIFNQNSTYARLMGNIVEAEEFEGHLAKVNPLFCSEDFGIFASKNIDFLPSGLIGTDSAAIVLKDPSVPSRTVGIYFLKGKEVVDVRNRILPLLRENKLIPKRIWVPELRDLIKERLKKIDLNKNTESNNR